MIGHVLIYTQFQFIRHTELKLEQKQNEFSPCVSHVNLTRGPCVHLHQTATNFAQVETFSPHMNAFASACAAPDEFQLRLR